jgi:hypothetical protein
MAVTTVKLASPVQWHGAALAEIRLKEPTGFQYIEIGEPRFPMTYASGGGYWVEDDARIRRYLDRCLDHEGGSMLFAQLALADAMAVKGALIDFFIAAAKATGAQ